VVSAEGKGHGTNTVGALIQASQSRTVWRIGGRLYKLSSKICRQATSDAAISFFWNMKTSIPVSMWLYGAAICVFTFGQYTSTYAQAIDPNRSAKAAQRSDAEMIVENIRDHEDVVFLSEKALERTKDERVKELAQLIYDNHIAMLYSMETLQAAGKGSSGQRAAGEVNRPEAAAVNEKLAPLRGPVFDSVWVASMLPMQQAKLEELTQAKETVTNPQLKMAVSEALPKLRKQVSQLNSVQKYLVRLATQKRKEEEAKRKESEKAQGRRKG
jgi:uncharacterized protein (DUF305 family)